MVTSLMDIRAALNEINYEEWYSAVVDAEGKLNSDWWDLINVVASMHPRYDIADTLYASLDEKGKVNPTVIDKVKRQLNVKGVRSLTNVVRAKRDFESFAQGVKSKLSSDKFIESCNTKNKGNGKYVISREMIEKGLKNIEIIFNALVEFFS